MRETDEGPPDETSRMFKMRRRWETLVCSFCAPHSGENVARKPKHGVKKKRNKKR